MMQPISAYHPVIGLLLFALISLQAIAGFVHHCMYKHGNQKDLVSLSHVWLGRILITLGMINGGLGLLFSSEAERSEYIAYGVITALIWLAYIGFVIYFGSREKVKAQKTESDIEQT